MNIRKTVSIHHIYNQTNLKYLVMEANSLLLKLFKFTKISLAIFRIMGLSNLFGSRRRCKFQQNTLLIRSKPPLSS